MKFYIAGNRKNPGGYYNVSFWKWILMFLGKYFTREGFSHFLK